MNNATEKLEAALAPLGFRALPHKEGSLFATIWKRQNLHMNRAVVLVEVPAMPADLKGLLKKVRKEAAFRCGFFPFFYGLGTQVVLQVTGDRPPKKNADRYVDKLDNQWSIIQSIFVVDADAHFVAAARTWLQLFTGKIQDAIEDAFTES